jgi:hypothetical protein
MMKTFKLLLVILVIHTPEAFSQVKDIPYKNDIPTRTLFIPSPNANAIVLLFPGGEGMMKLQDDGSTNNTHTFVRSKNMWGQYGIDAVLVDTPYSLYAGPKNIRSFSDHQERILAVVQYYKDKYHLPIWLFGHSMGTVSVTEFVNRAPEQESLIAGVIVAGTYQSVSLKERVKIPVQAIHHAQDGCDSTRPYFSESLIKDRPKEFVAQFVKLDGGVNVGNACGSAAYHGFNQIEGDFVGAAAKFMNDHNPNKSP